MKKILLLLIFQLLFNEMKASHIWGADLTYVCQGSGNYLVKLDYYRNCSGIPAPLSFPLEVSNTCGSAPLNYTLTSLTTVALNSCGGTTTCNGGPAFGIQKYTYTVVIPLPDTCSHWALAVRIGTRDAAISIFTDPSIYNLYIEAAINNTMNFCDTSVVFHNEPVSQVCANQLNCINILPFDIDGDSMVASFIPPRHDSNLIMPYDSGYSVNYPMELDSPLTINFTTGEFCFIPLSAVLSTYAIQISSFRNGVLIGQVMRDMNLFVTNCQPSTPELSGINGGVSVDTFVCVNTSLCFEINSSDMVNSDSTFISWDEAIPHASFIANNALHQTGTFCWQPGPADISSTPYCFRAKVNDNSCPSQYNEKTFCIMVYDSATCATINLPEINTNNYFNIYPQPASSILNVELINSNEELIFSIHDISGKIVFEQKTITGENKFSINTEFINSGIYSTSIRDEEGKIIAQKKLIISKD